MNKKEQENQPNREETIREIIEKERYSTILDVRILLKKFEEDLKKLDGKG